MSISQRAEELKKRMERAGLARVATTLQALLEPSIRLNAGGPSSQPTSRLGGLPNMPADFQWPTRRDGQPHSFLAQIDLAQLEAFDVLPLPSRGSLFFFCDAVDIPWGRDPGEKDGSAILYSASALNDNAPHTPPRELDGGYIFKGFSLEPVWDLTGPGIETWEIESLRLDNSESYAYSQLFAEDGTVHRIGGYPNVMQNDNLQLTAELVSHGIYCDAAGYKLGRSRGLEAGAADWQLLLQLDSEDEAGMMWGDAGKLFFMVREKDLKALNFDRAWLGMQGG